MDNNIIKFPMQYTKLLTDWLNLWCETGGYGKFETLSSSLVGNHSKHCTSALIQHVFCSTSLKICTHGCCKWIYERSYIWFAEKDMRPWLIIPVIHITQALVKLNLEKLRPGRVWTHDLCNRVVDGTCWVTCGFFFRKTWAWKIQKRSWMFSCIRTVTLVLVR